MLDRIHTTQRTMDKLYTCGDRFYTKQCIVVPTVSKLFFTETVVDYVY